MHTANDPPQFMLQQLHHLVVLTMPKELEQSVHVIC
jgi:hypothetical protein